MIKVCLLILCISIYSSKIQFKKIDNNEKPARSILNKELKTFFKSISSDRKKLNESLKNNRSMFGINEEDSPSDNLAIMSNLIKKTFGGNISVKLPDNPSPIFIRQAPFTVMNN